MSTPRKRRPTAEPRRRYHYAAYQHRPDGRWVMVSPCFTTMEAAERWANAHLPGDYLVTDLLEQPN